MELKALIGDDDAVSPVIGVILMVAITVILAAVIGTFVLGLGEQVGNAQPTTTFDFDYTEVDPGEDTLDITHNGGDEVPAQNLNASISGGDAGTAGNSVDGKYEFTNLGFGANDDVSTGDTATVSSSNLNSQAGTSSVANLDLSGATVRVIWTASGGGDSAPLGNWEGPDA